MAEADSFKDLEELGIDVENSDFLTEQFNLAANHLQSIVSSVEQPALLKLYGLYKQGSQGQCDLPKPSWYDMRAKAKWEAWNRLGHMPKEAAKRDYIEELRKIAPDFETAPKESWVSVSTLQNHDLESIDNKTIVDYVKEDNLSKIREVFTGGSKDVLNQLDEDGLGLIHWAADRGSVDVLKFFIDSGANINLVDSDGQSALHYAASCGHLECVKLLIANNAKRDIVDNNGSTPISAACDVTVKELIVQL